jgi:hypothetical protein
MWLDSAASHAAYYVCAETAAGFWQVLSNNFRSKFSRVAVIAFIPLCPVERGYVKFAAEMFRAVLLVTLQLTLGKLETELESMNNRNH